MHTVAPSPKPFCLCHGLSLQDEQLLGGSGAGILGQGCGRRESYREEIACRRERELTPFQISPDIVDPRLSKSSAAASSGSPGAASSPLPVAASLGYV